MNQKIYKQDGQLKIELSVPLETNRYNPYMGDEPTGKMDNILGVICGDEIGFAYWLDMSYAGKDDQISTLFYLYDGEPEEFKKLCQDLGLQLHEYPLCAYCGKPIMGSSTWGDKGLMCWECEQLTKENKKSIIKHDE
jgi:hypothetical protein